MRRLVFAAIAASLSWAVSGQQPTGVPPASAGGNDSSGAVLYRQYCAVCHGVDGKGGGPAAQALRQTPPDLTLLSLRNQGKFPGFRVAQTIENERDILAHGAHNMPVWGDIFRNVKRDEVYVRLRVHNLVQYLESIQGR